jgi:hypothetical protein
MHQGDLCAPAAVAAEVAVKILTMDLPPIGISVS